MAAAGSPLDLPRPIIQLAIDEFDMESALTVAASGVRAGVDWLEIGTPLLERCGLAAARALTAAFPGHPVLVDFKAMDGGGRCVRWAHEAGARLATVCAGASDATVASAVAVGCELGLLVVVDTIGVADQAGRSREVEALGASMIYLHYGADQRARDGGSRVLEWLGPVQAATRLPVGVATFDVSDAVAAAQRGVDVCVIGKPVAVPGPDGAERLARYCSAVRAAYRPAGPRGA